MIENELATTTKYSITELLRNKIKPSTEMFGLWLPGENLNNNLITNFWNINYTNLEEKLNEFMSITLFVTTLKYYNDCKNNWFYRL